MLCVHFAKCAARLQLRNRLEAGEERDRAHRDAQTEEEGGRDDYASICTEEGQDRVVLQFLRAAGT